MGARASRLSLNHVAALNIAEVEFQGDETVVAEWKQYLEHLFSPPAKQLGEEISSSTLEDERRLREERYGKRVGGERDLLLTKLLSSMATVLNCRVESLKILAGGYQPHGWATVEFEQGIIRKYAVDLYLGQRSLLVAVLDYGRKK